MMLGASSYARRIRPMPEQRVAEHLRRLPLFSRLPDSELAELADRVCTKSFRRGEMIFRKDDPGTHLYMVLEGGVKIALPGGFGQEALAAFIVASRVSVNRVLGDLERREIISIRRRRIAIKDADRLAKEVRF